MKRTLAAVLTIIVAAATLFSGCGKNEKSEIGEDGRMTITIGYPGADESWENDEYFKYITDKLNIDIEFQSLSKDSAAEKARIWIASGSMPDVVYSAFMMDEYLAYGEQGMVKPLPKDWQEKYPNLGFSMEMTGALGELKKAGNGEIYGLIRPLDHYIDYIEDFRAAYDEGKDLTKMMSEKQYRHIDSYGFAYRKDWAQQLGIETDYIMEYDAFIDMVKKFKEADLGKVGKKNTVGIAVDFTEAPNVFVTAFNSSYKYFHKDESGKYICGLTEDATVEGVKAYAEAYKTGILAPDFYTQKKQDLNSIFCSQRAGVIFPSAEESALRTLKRDFANANPGIDPTEAIGVCWILSPDGKVHGREAGNYNNAYYFNPEMSDEKLAKILELADYVSSVEGGRQVRLGVPGVDFDEEYNILREKNENGTYDALSLKYPSYEFFKNFLNPQYTRAVSTDPAANAEMKALRAAKLSNELSILEMDIARDSYVADDYVKFKAAYEVNGMFAEIITSDDDTEKMWDKKKAEIGKAAKSVEKNMNKALLGK